jgi:hypothetical protein
VTSRVVIEKATLTLVASETTPSIHLESGFVIRGVVDASPWLVNTDCDTPAAWDYTNRPRTLEAATYTPTRWLVNQPYEFDVTSIVQELVNNSSWTGEAVAFAIDKLHTSTATFRVYSFEGSGDDLKKRPTLTIQYTLDP